MGQAKVISSIIAKGGSGKTSSITNLSSVFATQYDKRVLLIDTDSQSNAANSFGISIDEIEKNLFDVLIEDEDPKNVILNVGENIDLLPSNEDMDFLDFEILPNLNKYEEPYELFNQKLSVLKEKYDYIFIDTPPHFGLVVGNVLNFTDEVIIPFAPEIFGVTGVQRVVKAVEKFQDSNKNLNIAGVLGMMIDSRTTLHTQMLQETRKFCYQKEINMFETIIPKSIRFASAVAYEGKPAVLTDKTNDLVHSYFELAEEVIDYVK
ncbi:ParA family protein [Alkalibacillus aidingensis]|uniref:ParA family protein n=1 Tax=Alkalibacillus aidingensis TaxID=2747607 RepID=UPI001660E669|nr:ParA family protein [Alkalibacillus aidingensis]